MQFSWRAEKILRELTADNGVVCTSKRKIPTAPHKKAAGPENQAPLEECSNA
jgi:hypothetical protein